MSAVPPDAGRLQAGVGLAGEVVLPGVERRLTRRVPAWATIICGTHTVDRAGCTVIMDECCEVRRALPRPRADSLLA